MGRTHLDNIGEIVLSEGAVMTEVHTTKELLINCVVELIRKVGSENVTSDLVLNESKVSKGSMYYHFEDFPDLMEQAQIEIFRQLVEVTLNGVNEALRSSITKSDFLAKIRGLTHGNMDSDLRASRLSRVEAIAIGMSSPRMSARLGEVQWKLNEGLMHCLEETKARGWLNPELDPLSIAIFVQAYQIGSVIDLLVPNPMNYQAWIELIDLILNEVILSEEV